MNRETQIEQNVRSLQPFLQLSSRYPDAIEGGQIMLFTARLLQQKTITTGQPVFAQASLKIDDVSAVLILVPRCGQDLEPNGIELQPSQPEHPLQRHRKISPTLA